MQANNDQDWAEDGAFWDEAWTDMNHRLDEKQPRRKRRAAWWWFTGGSLALLLVVTPLVFAGVFNGDNGPDAEAAPLKVPSPHPAAAPEKDVYADNAVAKGITDNTPEIADVAPTTTPQTPLTTPNPSRKISAKINPRNVAVAKILPVAKETPTTPPVSPVPTPVLPESSPEKVELTRDIPAVISSLARAELATLPVPNALALPSVVVGQKRRGALYLEAGALATATPNLTGFYAGVGYRIPLSERLSMPLSIRYRKESLPPGDFPTSGSAELAVVSPDPDTAADTSIVTGVTSPNRLNFTNLKTEVVELTTGLSYAFNPRFRATAGLNLSYMTRAQLRATYLPSANAQSFENTISLFGNFEEFRGTMDGSFTDRSEEALPDLAHLQFSGHLGISYDLTNRLSLSAAGTYLLRQPDRAAIIGLPAARAEVGLRWRLR